MSNEHGIMCNCQNCFNCGGYISPEHRGLLCKCGKLLCVNERCAPAEFVDGGSKNIPYCYFCKIEKPEVRITNIDDIIPALKKIIGAINYDGDYSSQVVFELKNGKTLRIGISDEIDGLFIDQYEGLRILDGNGEPTTDLVGREQRI